MSAQTTRPFYVLRLFLVSIIFRLNFRLTVSYAFFLYHKQKENKPCMFLQGNN